MQLGVGIAVGMLLALPCHAETPALDFKAGGFGTLGVVRNSTEEAEFTRELSQPKGAGQTLDPSVDSRLGLQADASLPSNLHATVQVVSKYGPDATFRPEVAWAFLGWTPGTDLQIRAGRLGFDIFMNADSRDVGFSYLWVRPPVEFFGEFPISRLNGLDAAQTFPLSNGDTLRIKAFMGSDSEQTPIPYSQGIIHYQTEGHLMGALAEFQTEAWRWRVTWTQLKLSSNLPGPVAQLQQGLEQFGAALRDARIGQAASDLDLVGHKVRFLSLGCSYERQAIQAMAMVDRVSSDTLLYPGSWSGFLSLGYHLGAVTPYALYSRILSQRTRGDLGMLPQIPTPQAQALVAGYQGTLTGGQNDQVTTALGLRWNFAANADLKLQVDQVHVRRGHALWKDTQPSWGGEATVASLALDFIF